MIKRKRIFLVLLAVAVLGGSMWWISCQPQEPVYDGRRLSVWLRPYEAGGVLISPRDIEIWRKSDEAVRAIGTNAIPFLLQRFRTTDSSLPRRLVQLAAKQRLVKIPYTPAGDLHCEAVIAFQTLGAVASNAVPELIEISRQNTSTLVGAYAIDSLGYIGPAASDAVPFLLRCLRGTNNSVRDAAAAALGQIHPDAKSVVPALMIMLRDSDPGVRYCAACSLGQFGAEARPAVPLLIEQFNSLPVNLWSTAKPAIGKPSNQSTRKPPPKWASNEEAETHFSDPFGGRRGGRVSVVALLRISGAELSGKGVEGLVGNLRSGRELHWLWANPETDEAIRRMGTNAIPALLKMISARDSKWKSSLSWYSTESMRRRISRRLSWWSAGFASDEAAQAFVALGPSASNAVPQLIQTYRKNIGPDSQASCLKALGAMGVAARQAIPEFLDAMSNSYLLTRESAVEGLGNLHAEPGLAVPVLITRLQDSSDGVRRYSVAALAKFGPEAKAAVKVWNGSKGGCSGACETGGGSSIHR